MTQDPAAPAPSRRRTPGWVRATLFVSLALNLAVVGAVGGAFFKFQSRDERPARLSRDLGLGPYMFALDDDGRDFIRSRAKERRRDFEPTHKMQREAFAKTLEVIRTDPLDTDALRSLITIQSDAALRGRELGQDLLMQRLSTMDVAERNVFADRLEEMLRRHGSGKKGGKKNRDD